MHDSTQTQSAKSEQAPLTLRSASEPVRPRSLTIDLTGLRCPLPILKARARLRKLKSGTIVSLLTTDQQAINDVAHFCQRNHHRLIRQERAYDNVTRHIICVLQATTESSQPPS